MQRSGPGVRALTERHTGKTRFRALKRFLRKPIMVLQVEVEKRWPGGVDPYDMQPHDGMVRVEWRDATLEDMTVQGTEKRR